MVEEHRNSAPRPGAKAADPFGKIVGAFHLFDDDTFDAKVIAPHLLDQLRIVNALDPNSARPCHPSRSIADIDRARRRERDGRWGFMDCRLAKGDRFAVDHERTRPRGDGVIAPVTITNDDLLRFERQDRPDRTTRSVLDDNTHLGSDRAVGRF